MECRMRGPIFFRHNRSREKETSIRNTPQTLRLKQGSSKGLNAHGNVGVSRIQGLGGCLLVT